MQAFRRHGCVAVCTFEPAEIDLLESLACQLIELLLDEAAAPSGPGTARVQPQELDDNADDIFARLEREMSPNEDHFDLQPAIDPVLKRLYPDAYPGDAAASHDFQRFTQTAQRDDKVASAQRMLTDLRAAREADGRCQVRAPHTTAWLKGLTNVRLALAVRMGIDTADDADYIAELPDDDPRSWVFSIYEWTGWVQESLLAAQE